MISFIFNLYLAIKYYIILILLFIRRFDRNVRFETESPAGPLSGPFGLIRSNNGVSASYLKLLLNIILKYS